MRLLKSERGRQPARYLISGGACALANNALLIAGARAGLATAELSLLSFAIIGTAGYGAHVHFTFRQKAGWRSYARFMAGVALGVPVAFMLLLLLRDVMQVPMVLAAPIATIVLMAYNYISARLAIMRRLLG